LRDFLLASVPYMTVIWTTDCEKGLEDVTVEISLDVVGRVLRDVSNNICGI
jgi:hypothetical protein